MEMPSLPHHNGWRIVLCTALALIAFAANSLLCRLALGNSAIDPAGFSTIRILSGAAVLVGIALARRHHHSRIAGGWTSATLLVLYAVPFSFAYVSLSAGTGALILFGAVQATMFIVALYAGERPHISQWIGLSCAFGGLVYLVMPGLTAPSPLGSALMATAGVAWGAYSLRGQGKSDPLAETAGNFLRAAPLVIAISIATLSGLRLTPSGISLALLSGAVASGFGYAIWYTALAGLTSTKAATVQLTVPILAAVGGVLWLGETISLRQIISAILVLGGVGLTLQRRR